MLENCKFVLICNVILPIIYQALNFNRLLEISTKMVIRQNKTSVGMADTLNRRSFWRTHMSFFGATGTSVLDFWWRLLWGSKPEWVLPYLFFCEGECSTFPKIHHWCYTCRPLDGQHAAGHFPPCMCKGGAWLRFERAITRTEDKRATIVPATRLYSPCILILV